MENGIKNQIGNAQQSNKDKYKYCNKVEVI